MHFARLQCERPTGSRRSHCRRSGVNGLARRAIACLVVLVGVASVVAPSGAQGNRCPDGPQPLVRGGDSDQLDAADLEDVDLSCGDLSGVTVDGADLASKDLSGLFGAGAALSGFNLTAATLDDADLSGAALAGIVAPRAGMDRVDLGGADVTNSVFDHVDLRRATLEGATFVGSSFRYADLRGVELNGSDLSGTDFTGSNLSGALLDGATITDSLLEGADLARASLDEAVLRGSRLWDADLSDVVLVNADVRDVDLSGADLDNADLAGADLSGAIVPVGALSGADLEGATCPDGEVAQTDSSGASSCADQLTVPTTTQPGDGGGSTDASPALQARSTAGAPQVVLVLDQSNSMGLPSGGAGSRLDAAKRAVSQLTERIPRGTDVGFLSYGGGDYQCDVASTLPVRPLDDVVASDIVSTVSAITVPPPPVSGSVGTNGTPTAIALREAGSLLSGFGPRTIVLVSDGESNCGEDACVAASELADQGVAITVNTIGFQIYDSGREELQCIADATGGVYEDVSRGRDLARRIELLTVASHDWVALGDSFSSGEGAEDFARTQPQTNACHRSIANNYSAQAVRLLNQLQSTQWSRNDVTCSGATTRELSHPQRNDDGSRANDPQLDGIRTLSPLGARILTLTFGGNDAGFRQVLEECVVAGLPTPSVAFGLASLAASLARAGIHVPERPGDTCQDKNEYDGSDDHFPRGYHTEDFIGTELSGIVEDAYDSIRQRWSRDSQEWLEVVGDETDDGPADVYVLGYPQIFPHQHTDEGPAASCNTIDGRDLEWLRGLTTKANDVIERAVGSIDDVAQSDPLAGLPIRFHYVDVEDAFVGHELCAAAPGAEQPTDGSPTGPWVNGIRRRNLLDPIERNYFFHPNAAGHHQMAEILAQVIGDREQSPAPDPTAPPAYALTMDAPASQGEANDARVTVGARVQVTAGRFEPNTAAQIVVSSESLVLAEPTTDDQGQLSAEVVIPQIEPGDHELGVFAETANGLDARVAIPFQVVDPNQSQPLTEGHSRPWWLVAVGVLAVVTVGALAVAIARRRGHRVGKGLETEGVSAGSHGEREPQPVPILACSEGHEIPPDAAYCPECGRPTPPAAGTEPPASDAGTDD